MPFDEKFSELLKFKKESIYVYPNPKMIRDNNIGFKLLGYLRIPNDGVYGLKLDIIGKFIFEI